MPESIDVDVDALHRTAADLRNHSEDLSDTARSAPDTVVAGVMTGHITSMLAAVMKSAATLADSLTAAATSTDDSARQYATTEADVTVSLSQVQVTD